MALIDQLPAQAVIDSFRGVLDFYVWCDLNIVRKWPQSPGRARNKAVQETWPAFVYVNQTASTLSAKVVATWQEMAGTGGLTWKDWLNRCYLSGSFAPKDAEAQELPD